MNPEKVKQLYNFLADNGVEDIGTDMGFMARMQNIEDRVKVYNFLAESGVEDMGETFAEFDKNLGIESAPQAKIPSFEDFKEATVAQSRQSVEGRLAEARESLSRTTATGFATEKLFKPHTDIVQEERDYILRPTEKVLNNIFESNKQYREQKEGAKNAQTHYAAGAGAIKTPQMDTVSKVSHIGKEEYKYLKGQRDIALSNINNLIEEAHKIQKQMIEEGGGSVKGVNSITGATTTLPSREAYKFGSIISAMEKTRDKYEKMVTEADKAQGKKGGLGAGLGEIDALNILTAGWLDVLQGIDEVAIVQKASEGRKLTPEEQLYIKMLEEKSRLEGIVEAQGGATQGYNIGSGLAESLPFITSMLSTSGIASAVKGGVNKGLGAIGREAAKEGAEKSFKKFAGRALSRGIDNLVGSAAAAAVTTPLQAGMYNNYIDNAVNEYMTYGKLTDSPIQRLWKSGADAFTDNFTEHLGGVFTGAAKYTLKNYGANAALGRLFGTFGRRIQPFYKDILKRTAYNGFVGEFEEEMWANFLSPFMRGDSKEERQEVRREAFSKENIITTLATTALMSAGFGAGKVVSAADATRKYEKFKKNARNALANIEDRRLEQKLVDIMALPTLQERCQAFANMNWQGDYKSMGHGVDYFYNSILKEVYDGVVKMEDANEVVMPTLRTLNTVVERGTSDVVTAQMDGKPVYIIRGVGDNAESAIVQDMEGNRQQVAMSSLQEVNVTPVSEVVADLINKEYNAISAEMDAQEQAEEDATLRERGLVPPSDRAKADQFEPEEVVMVNGKTATINSIDKASGTARVDIEGEEVNQQVNIADMQKITPEQISSEVEAQQINQPALTQDGEIDIVAMGEEQTANYISEKADASYVEDMLADRRKKLERAQKGIRLPLNLAERQKAIEQRDAEIARLEQEISMWEGVKNRLTQPQPTSEVAQETADVAEAQEVTQQEVTPEQVVEQTTEEVVSNVTSLDKQGNPIDKDGNLLVDVVESIDDITDEDFDNPTRSIQLPALPNNVDEAIGADGKPVIIKKNIFERNAVSHSDLTPEQSRQILKSALYSPKLYGQNQKRRKPYNWVVISVQDESAPNKLVLLEVNEGKDNVEIVHWHYIDQRGLEKLKRQAEREDGQLLILPSEVSEEVGALADPTLNQPSTDKNTTSVPENQTSEQKNVTEEEKITEQTPEKEVEDTAEDIHTREQVDALEWKAGVVMNEEARNHKATEALDDMAKAAGVRVAFVDSIVEGGKEANGLYDPRTKTIYIASDRLKGANFVAGHEMLHHIKTLSPQAYKEYMEAVKAEVGAERFDEAVEGLRQTYRIAILGSLKKRGIVTENTTKEERESLVEREMPSDEVLTEEVVADWTGSLIGYSGGFSDFVKRYKGGAVLRVLRNAVEHIGTFFKGRNSWERTMQRRLKALNQFLTDGITEEQQKNGNKSQSVNVEKQNTGGDELAIALAKQGYIERLPNKTKYNVWSFTADESSRPIRTTPTILEGVFYDNGFRVASDGIVLVKEKFASYPAEYEGTARMRDGSRTDNNVSYPKYQVVIDNLRNNKSKKIDFDDFLGFLNAVIERETIAHKQTEGKSRSLNATLNNTAVVIKLPTGDIWYGSLDKLQKFALAGKQFGADKVYFKDASTMLLAKNNKGEVALVMPVLVDLYPPYRSSTRYYYEPTLETKPQVVQSSSANKRSLERITPSADKTIIEDVGEEIKGARKNALKELAEKLNNVTIENLIALPLSKVFKPTNYAKMVQKGTLPKEDALLLEAITMLITQSSKPKLTKRYDSKKNLESWANRQYALISAIKQYCNADENVKPDIKERILAEPDHIRESAMVEQRKKWNPHLAEKYGDTYTPNPIKVMLDVLRALGYPSAEVGKIDIPTIVANGFNNGYEAQTMNGKRIYSINGDVDYNAILNDIVRYCKIQLGHTDITYDMGKDIRVIGSGNPLFKETGKYIVYYFKNSKSTIVSEQLFDSKEEANNFAEKYKDVRVKPQRERNGYEEYGFCIIDVVSGERLPLDLPKFPTLEDARAYMQDNTAEINDKANAVVADHHTKGKGISDTSLPLNVGLSYKPANGTKSYVVYLDAQGERVPIKEGFATVQDAYKWLEDNRSKIEDEFAKQKKQQAEFVFFEGEKPRVGKDYRQGKDMTAEDFRDTFGFRGVQFGNWTNQKDRQNAINEAYDALMDMSEILGISPKAVSLNGELGIAFGARGGGRYNAHYELDNIVINLTKTRGAGSLAHEWWHALDNYFARQGGVSMGMATEVKGINIRSEVKDAFRDVVNAVSGTAYDKRSKKRGQYWGSIVEETARLFGEWIVYEAEKRGITNSFLSRGVDAKKFEVWQRGNYEAHKIISGEDITFEEYVDKYDSLAGMPYPDRAETEAMSAPMRALFDTIEERETEEGNVVLFSLREVNDRFNEQLATLTEENKDRAILSLGMPSDILRAAGVVNKPMKLYGNKVIKKQKDHGFQLDELQNLPIAVAYPIAVFNNYNADDNRSILTELRTKDGNFLVSLNVGKDQDIDFNIVASVFGKDDNNVVSWFNKGYATYIDKEKALNYLHHSAPIAEALSNSRQVSETNLSAPIAEALNQEIISATNVVQNFENPSIEPKFSIRTPNTFYSNAEFAVRNIKQEKATPEQWLKMIEKNGGLKAGEDKWLGLSDWLKESKAKTLTKQEVLDYINSNKIVVEDVEYGVQDYMSENEIYESDEYRALEESLLEYEDETPYIDKEKFKELRNKDEDFVDGFDVDYWGEQLLVKNPFAAARYLGISNVGKRINVTRLQYTTNGLTNKREIALVVPTIEPWNADDNIHFGDAGEGRAVAWVRFGETEDEYGYRTLVIDEIQSKRHQDGREKGYISDDVIEAQRQYDYLYNKMYKEGLTEEEHNRYYFLGEFIKDNFGIVPSAPFEKNWHEVAMKRILRYAAENGYDKVAWTTGDQQAERYNIGNVIESAKIMDGADGGSPSYRAVVLTPENDIGNNYVLYVNEDGIIRNTEGAARNMGLRDKHLSDVVGKALAEKLLSSPNNTSISGDGLQIGGEGMRAFYDQILPNFMNKYGKKWGVKVGEVTMPDLAENNTMHSVDITYAMRESVMQGQPLFSIRNMVPTDEPVTYNNFYNSTAGIWEALPISEAPTREPDYESKRWDGFGISSRYWYGEDEGGEYVIRESDHWSRTIKSDVSAEDFKRNPYGKYASIPIASCRWALDYRNVAIDEYADKKGVSYGKIYLQDLTHYEDTYVRHSLRLPEYQESFKALTEEYNALDKNDAKALADFRARKRTLVEEYWNDFARALGADVETMVIDSTNNPEALRPIYNMFKAVSGEDTPFEEFVEAYQQAKMSASHIENTNVVFVDMAKVDEQNTRKAFARMLIHEQTHTLIQNRISSEELERIWAENKNTPLAKRVIEKYPKKSDEKLGNELLAYAVSGMDNDDIRPVLDYIEGKANSNEDKVLAVVGKLLPLGEQKAKQLLNIIYNGYQEKGAKGTQYIGGVANGLRSGYTGRSDSRRRDGGYSAGETYIENGRRVTVLDEDFSIVEDIPEFDESPKYSLKDPIEQLRKENGIVAKSFEKENELIAEKFGTEGVGRKIEKGMFNYLADVQRLQDNLYAAGVMRSDDNDFVNKMEGVRNMVKRVLPQELEKYVHPLLKVISTITQKFGFDYTAISDYLAAKHSIEREDESKIQTMSTEANAVWNRERVEKIVSDFESKVPENVRELLWKGVKGIEQRTLEILKKVGVYTAADIEAIQSHNWKYYVPLQGWDTKEEELIEVNKIYDLPQSGTSSTNGRWQEHSAKGRRTKPYDPLATIVAKLHKAVYVAETNKAMHALYNLVTDATRALGTEKVSFIFKASDAYYRKTQDGYEEIDADEVTPEELESNRKLHAELRKLYNERKQTDDAATIKKIDAQIKAAKSKLTIFVKAGDMAIPKEVNISQQTTRARRVYFYMNGKRMYIQFVNPKYSAAINGQTLWKRNELDKFVAGWTRWLSKTYTSLNPEFSFVTNPIRDFRDAVITHLLDAEHGNIVGFAQYMLPFSGARSAIFRAQRGTAQPLSDKELEEYNLMNRDDRKALIRKYGEKRVYDTLFKWYADNGGVTGGGRVYSVQTVADDLKDKVEKLKKGDISTHANALKALSESAEITTRFATFLASLDKGESVRQAVVNGRNVSVNFNRKGAWSDKIGAYHSFFNASAQGIYKYLTLARKYPKRFVAVAMSQIALGYATCLLIDYLYDLLLPDDDGDEIQTIEIPLWERLGYTAIPFMRRNGKVHTIRIPKSITFASFSAIGVLLNELQKQRITGEEAILAAASQMMSSWTYGFSEGAPFWRAAVPTVLQPIADIMNNTDAFGREVYRTDRFKQGIPNSELGLRNVIPWMYSMTKALNKATGGNEFKSGVIDINPSVVQYIMEQYAGGFGVLARKAIEFGASLFTDKVEFEMQNLPLLGRLTYTVEPKSWYPDYKKVQDAFGAAVFSNARNQYQAGYITEDELRQIGMRNYIFKNNDKVIKNLIDLRGNYAPSSMEYKVINREINRQRGLVVKIFEEADFNNRNSISEIIKKYDPNRSNNLTNLYKEYAK